MSQNIAELLEQQRRATPKRAEAPAFQGQRILLEGVSAPVIFDVGAMIGDVSAIYRHLFPTARIYAFEPFAGTFNILRQGLSNDAQTTAFQIALGATTGKQRFHVNAAPMTNSLLPTDTNAGSVWGHGLVETRRAIEVAVEKLDDFAARQSIERIDLLKLDVQGAEPQVLDGAAGIIGEGRVGAIYSEIIVAPTYTGQKSLSEILAQYDRLGFDLVNLYNLNRKGIHLRQMDGLFVHGSRGMGRWV